MRRFFRILLRFLLLSALVFFIAVNALAWMHVHTVTHFTPAGSPPPVLEHLTLAERARIAVQGIPMHRAENHFTPADGGYTFETHTIQLSEDEWLEAWWVAHPQPRGIVLLFHGYAASKQQVLGPAEVFYHMGFSVFLVDFRGAGGSSGSTTTIGVHEAADVAQALSYVQQTWPEQPTVLYGTSMGSAAILRAVAVERAQPDAVVAETPFGELLSTIRVRVRSMGVPESPAAELLLFWGGVQHGFNGFAHNPSDYAYSIATPTVLLRGAEDARVSAREIEAIHTGLQGSKQLVIVPHVGHNLLLTQTPEVQQQVNQFLSEQAGL